jgi:hypothetical protein
LVHLSGLGRAEQAVEADHAADARHAVTRQVERAQPAEAEADRADAVRIDVGLVTKVRERRLGAPAQQRAIGDKRVHQRAVLGWVLAALAGAVHVDRQRHVPVVRQLLRLRALELALARPLVEHQHARTAVRERAVECQEALEFGVAVLVSRAGCVHRVVPPWGEGAS